MMDEELHLQPVQTGAILRSAVVITIATLIGHLIPLVPFVLARTAGPGHGHRAQRRVLFGVGVYSAVTLVGDWRTSGLNMVVIGLGAAAIGFLSAACSTPPGGEPQIPASPRQPAPGCMRRRAAIKLAMHGHEG